MEATAVVEEIKKELEPPLNEILNRIKSLTAVADQRAFARSEIEHYKDKVTRLANEGLADAKKQDKAESNQGKLKENQALFTKLDAELQASLAALDDEIAGLTNGALAAFVSLQVGYNKAVVTVYNGAMNVANGPGAVAAVEVSAPADPESTTPSAAPAMSMDSFTGGAGAVAGGEGEVQQAEATAEGV